MRDDETADDASGAPRDLAPEDAMRADLYALLARLFRAPPDAGLLAMIADAPEIGTEADDAVFAKAWAALALAARAAEPRRIAEEHAALFGGDGAARVAPGLTRYLGGAFHEKLLSELSEERQRLRIPRSEPGREPEDHVAALLDAMRQLAGAGSGTLALARQSQFFERWIAPGFAAFCKAVRDAEDARFYRLVADLAERFLTVESEGLSML